MPLHLTHETFYFTKDFYLNLESRDIGAWNWAGNWYFTKQRKEFLINIEYSRYNACCSLEIGDTGARKEWAQQTSIAPLSFSALIFQTKVPQKLCFEGFLKWQVCILYPIEFKGARLKPKLFLPLRSRIHNNNIPIKEILSLQSKMGTKLAQIRFRLSFIK